MTDAERVAGHYARGGLLAAITAGLNALGKVPETATSDDLGPVDEFHIGGRVASEAFLSRLGPGREDHILDIGCGLGGAGRFAAERYGCRVTGIDLTADYVDTGNVLSGWVGLEERVFLKHGDATRTPFADAAFDKAYMLHVGMNIADKAALAREVHRLLRPGGVFGVYDIMRTGEKGVTYPVPWAMRADGCALASSADYRTALEAAGFRVTAERDRRDFALEFFARLQAKAAGRDGPPPLGLHILMGDSAPLKVRNMIENIAEKRITPYEMIAEKAA